MECKYCKKYRGDCGHHFIDIYGHVNFDVPKVTVLNRFGDCGYYEDSRTDFQQSWDYLTDLVKNHKFNREYALIISNKINDQKSDINKLIGFWFSALEDTGGEPFECDECIQFANKYGYTEKDYKAHLSTIC